MTPVLEVELSSAPTLCYAMEQTGVPLIRDVVIRNKGETPLRDAKLELRLVPGLGEPHVVALPEIKPGDEHALGVIDYRLAPERLRSVREAERARLEWTVRANGDANGSSTSGARDVEVLAWNEWPGDRAPVALLATFVTPNDPVVPAILRRVRDRLVAAGADGGIEGYQERSPKRVRALVCALYETIQALGLTYVSTAASFEKSGQKVRLASELVREGMGNCLDVTVLVASCLEQMGLNPLLVLVQGHALPGVWLTDERFPEGVVEDAARLRTLVQLEEVLLFDSSTTVAQPRVPFERALEVGTKHVAKDETFLYALDVRVLRADRYRPLPVRVAVPVAADASSAPPDATAGSSTLKTEVAKILDEAAREPEAPPPARPVREVPARFQRWQEKLLDLTLRNRLIHSTSKGKTSLPLDVPNLALFEDRLATEKPFDLLPAPPKDAKDQRDDALAQARAEEEAKARRLDDLSKGVLHVPLAPDELWSRARALQRRARTDMEEGGASTLYAAIGFLRWFETAESEEEKLAPLLLYPVELTFDLKKRRSVLRRLDEDPVVNVTLIEKVRRDHGVDLGAIQNVPLDDNGLDVPELLRLARTAIQRVPRWEVLEQAHLGIFTFTKFLMWKDLAENGDALLQSGVVRHIAAREEQAFPAQGELVPADGLDEKLAPDALPLVLDADSTQVAAVASALAGRSFVLQGPPGTGKSQTITNLIAAAMAAGKSVLFVSEKMAALEVVHRRLSQVGLGDFCLELHSHKSNKKQVLESIGAAFDRAQRVGQVPWEERSRDLAHLRTTLNDYARALHARRASGWTFYQAQARLLELNDAPELRAKIDKVETLTEEQIGTFKNAVLELAPRAAAVEPAAAHPWRAARLSDWSAAIEEEVRDAIDAVLQALTRVESLSLPAISTTALASYVELARELAAGPIPTRALSGSDWPQQAARARAWLDARKKQRERRALLEQRWKPELLGPELPALHASLSKWAHAFAPIRWLMLIGARGRLRELAKAELADPPALLADTTVATQIVDRDAQLELDKAELIPLLEGAWNGPDDDSVLETVLARGDRARGALERLRAAGASEPPFTALAAASTPPGARAQLASELANWESALTSLSSSEERLRKIVVLAPGQGWPASSAVDHRPRLREAATTFRDSVPALRSWAFYRREVARLEALGLAPLVQAFEAGTVPSSALERAFERWLLGRWTVAVRDAEPVLRSFDGGAHHALVERFARADKEHVELARRYVVAKLESRLPQTGAAVSENSETGILLRELKKKTRHLPVRRLVQSLPNLLPRLKPCFLMSPLSVAQYLPAQGRKFDLVVFDEASQIGTHDGVGAIARGAQVVVVGDSKQLPPTTFFVRNVDDDDAAPDENDVVELESILDEAVAKQMPQQMLGWHYRSRHESLIDFSNRHYYDERLFVFPAARGRGSELGVRWRHVANGVYRSGKERTNPEEARALVEHLVAELRATPPGSRSFGVVTFNASQQELVTDLLDEARARVPAIDAHFATDLPEPVFVKNLENVQGDERDEILFSVTYAKDQNGRLRVAFGPLSISGGERRLNVAITRARSRLTVFSTLTHDQIDLSRTASVGTAHLRAFLEYAARTGESVKVEDHPRAFPSRLEREVHDALVARGHAVHTQVGCGNYRVDLAVLDPERPGSYLLGVECDGPNYASAHTARDRDRLRRSVLGLLGWSVHRTWSPDWMLDREGELKRLDVALEKAKADAAKAEAARAEAAKAAPPPEPVAPSPLPDPPPHAGEGAPAVAPPSRPYVTTPLEKVGTDPDAFYATGALPKIRTAIDEVVRVEGPVHEDVVARRVLACWGWTKLTPRARQRVRDEAAALERAKKVVLRDGFLWPPALAPEALVEFRTPTDGSPRDPDQIPLEEVTIAVAWVLKQNLSLPRADLARETARLLGFARAGQKVADRIDAAIAALASAGRCTATPERVEGSG